MNEITYEIGNAMAILDFMDADLEGDENNWSSQTDILMFCNESPIHWYSNKHATCKYSLFCSGFCTIHMNVDMLNHLQYKIQMFGIPINGPNSIFYNEAVYKNTVQLWGPA